MPSGCGWCQPPGLVADPVVLVLAKEKKLFESGVSSLLAHDKKSQFRGVFFHAKAKS